MVSGSFVLSGLLWFICLVLLLCIVIFDALVLLFAWFVCGGCDFGLLLVALVYRYFVGLDCSLLGVRFVFGCWLLCCLALFACFDLFVFWWFRFGFVCCLRFL